MTTKEITSLLNRVIGVLRTVVFFLVEGKSESACDALRSCGRKMHEIATAIEDGQTARD